MWQLTQPPPVQPSVQVIQPSQSQGPQSIAVSTIGISKFEFASANSNAVSTHCTASSSSYSFRSATTTSQLAKSGILHQPPLTTTTKAIVAISSTCRSGAKSTNSEYGVQTIKCATPTVIRGTFSGLDTFSTKSNSNGEASPDAGWVAWSGPTVTTISTPKHSNLEVNATTSSAAFSSSYPTISFSRARVLQSLQ